MTFVAATHILAGIGLIGWGAIWASHHFLSLEPHERMAFLTFLILFRSPFWFVPICLVVLGKGLLRGQRTTRLITIAFDALLGFLALVGLIIPIDILGPLLDVGAFWLLPLLIFSVVCLRILLQKQTRTYIEDCESEEKEQTVLGIKG